MVAPAVHGTILEVHIEQSAHSVGRVLVKGSKEQHQGSLEERFWLLLGKETKVVEQQTQGCHPASFASLQAGQRIRVQIDNFILQSSPPQVQALQLVIVADEGDGS
jgi:hypothetical protein